MFAQVTLHDEMHALYSVLAALCLTVSNRRDNICLSYFTVACALLFLLPSHCTHPCSPLGNGYGIFSTHRGLLSDLWTSKRTPEASSFTGVSQEQCKHLADLREKAQIQLDRDSNQHSTHEYTCFSSDY